MGSVKKTIFGRDMGRLTFIDARSLRSGEDYRMLKKVIDMRESLDYAVR